MSLPVLVVNEGGVESVAFLPGIGTTGRLWEPVCRLLPGIRCVCLDLPGHGRAGDVPWVSLEDTADRVLEALEGRAAHLVGLSLGAYVGVHVLRRAPGQFQSALLSGMHPGPLSRRFLYKIIVGLTAPLVRGRAMARMNARSLRIADAHRTAFIEAAVQTRPRAVRRAYGDVIDFRLPDGLSAVEARVTVAAGSEENALILGGMAEIAAAFPRGTTYLAEGMGHAWPAQDPERFAALVKRTVSAQG